MKIIGIHSKEEKRIRKAKNSDREAQQKIFELYAPKMLSVCRNYVKDLHHAEDLMLDGFFKVFTKIDSYKNNGNFEGWIRRIMINTCISHLRKTNKIEYVEDLTFIEEPITDNFESTEEKELQNLIDELPEGYKIVFNLYAIEGYKHAEIAIKLGITESTSKSQLFKARKWLQAHYLKRNQLANGDK